MEAKIFIPMTALCVLMAGHANANPAAGSVPSVAPVTGTLSGSAAVTPNTNGVPPANYTGSMPYTNSNSGGVPANYTGSAPYADRNADTTAPVSGSNAVPSVPPCSSTNNATLNGVPPANYTGTTPFANTNTGASTETLNSTASASGSGVVPGASPCNSPNGAAGN